MENASKALIIAGAILLAILLISLGIMIYNQAQSVVDGSGMSEAELSTFNNKFTKYEGSQRGSVVKSMINEIQSNNANNTDRKILYDATGGITGLCENGKDDFDTSKLDNNKKYNVSFGRTSGRISTVKISE